MVAGEEAAGHVASLVGKCRQLNTGAHAAFSVLFGLRQAHGMEVPVRAGLPTPADLVQKHLHRYTQTLKCHPVDSHDIWPQV